uniref:Nuclear inhibitor of protein phosphatase 1-like n=1 Tax=Phallusia mammillata TaxID=59560 RepID=A0A6F9DPJ1_9ASCI|nr:nuclear inhibitor of protein phosphatase 1-like [Phallusia mammillata]
MSKIKTGVPMPSARTDFEIPSWAGMAPPGTHLDVMKGDKLIEKLIIDEKKCYFFGRNSESCDFVMDHASCSRVHSALMFHKHLKRMFIVDLGSMHGSFIRNLRLEPKKPTPIPYDTNFHFGASTRSFILKERPPITAQREDAKTDEDMTFDLPQEEEELENLTEFNTAHNKRVTALQLEDMTPKFKRRKRKSVAFAGEEEVINPEDIDSSVGRFRNMISVQMIPNKRPRESTGLVSASTDVKKHIQEFYNQGLYEDLDKEEERKPDPVPARMSGFVPNLAPEIEDTGEVAIETSLTIERPQVFTEKTKDLKQRKKYVKEAWPGKRPAPALLV